MRDELEIMREARNLMLELPDDDARVRVLKWLGSACVRSGAPSPRGAGDKWKSVMGAVADAASFTLDDLEEPTRGNGIKRASVRAQMHHYVKRGWLTQPSAGNWEWTANGRAELLNA